jgi:hypothetical protein
MSDHVTTVTPIAGPLFEWCCTCGAPKAGTYRSGPRKMIEGKARTHVSNANYRARKR